MCRAFALHISFFRNSLVLEEGVLPARLKVADPAQRGVVEDAECFSRRVDGECFPRQVGVSIYKYHIIRMLLCSNLYFHPAKSYGWSGGLAGNTHADLPSDHCQAPRAAAQDAT